MLDDYSRYIISWKLCSTMRVGDVTDTLDMTIAASGCEPSPCSPQVPPAQRQWSKLYRRGTGGLHRSLTHEPLRSAPFHPLTQGMIERWHQILKNHILLEN